MKLEYDLKQCYAFQYFNIYYIFVSCMLKVEWRGGDKAVAEKVLWIH